jgi:putative transposase
MPSRNVRKVDVAGGYYHVYARGASKQPIFLEPADYYYFINLFNRYLSRKQQVNKAGVVYPNYREKVELLCYCLMNNHFHILLYQKEQGGMSQFMKSVMISYGRYFNLKYKRSGSLYESTYKASMINADNYLVHISRYIHLNPRYWQRYKYSSIRYYLEDITEEWLEKKRVMELFTHSSVYKLFLQDYEEHKTMLDELKDELANT